MATKKADTKLADISNTPTGVLQVRGVNVELKQFTRGEHHTFATLGDERDLSEKIGTHEHLKTRREALENGFGLPRSNERVAVLNRFLRVNADLKLVEPTLHATVTEEGLTKPHETTQADWERYRELGAESDGLADTLNEIDRERDEYAADLRLQEAEAGAAALSALEDTHLRMLWRVLTQRYGYEGSEDDFLNTATPDETDAAERVCRAGNAPWAARMRGRMALPEVIQDETSGTPSASSEPDSPQVN